jgi:hypothetical protein
MKIPSVINVLCLEIKQNLEAASGFEPLHRSKNIKNTK